MASIVELTERNTCKLCENALAKYSCPRCNILYCSLDCYKSSKHDQCSECFYKDCIQEHLSLSKDDLDSETKMKEILQRFNKQSLQDEEADFTDDNSKQDCEEASSDDEQYENLVDRFSEVDLEKQSAEEIWSKLTSDEQQEFVAFLRSGDVSKLVPAWEPWWLFHDEQKIEEVGCENKQYIEKCPKLVKIKDFNLLSTKLPHDCVKYNLMNVLASYALAVRYFNGEHQDFGKEAATCIVGNSLCLKVNQNFDDFESAVKSVEQECLNSDWIIVDQENMVKMKEDLLHILKGPSKTDKKYYILSSLSDIHNLLKKALKDKEENAEDSFTKKFPSDHMPKVKLESDEKIKQAHRKIEYLLSYAKDCFTYD